MSHTHTYAHVPRAHQCQPLCGVQKVGAQGALLPARCRWSSCHLPDRRSHQGNTVQLTDKCRTINFSIQQQLLPMIVCANVAIAKTHTAFSAKRSPLSWKTRPEIEISDPRGHKVLKVGMLVASCSVCAEFKQNRTWSVLFLNDLAENDP